MPAQQQNKTKGNPASTRMMNPKLKERRARSWARTEKAKADGTHRTVQNRINNALYAEIKAANFGLGQRAVRRILSGKTQNHGLSDAQVEALVLIHK